MNVADLMSFFGGDSAAKLGQAVGLDAQSVSKALNVGLPMQIDALADHASSPSGVAQIADAIQNLPKFGSVGDALSGADGMQNLLRAGELLGPALLGGKSEGIVNAITSQLGGGSAGGAQKLMQMALPLLLSQMGQKGMNAGNLAGMLGGLKGGLGGLLGAGAAMAGLGSAAHAVSQGSGLPGVAGALTSGGLLDLLKGQFSGALGDKIGAAAGFGGSTAGRAAQAALPLVLNALVNKGKTEGGAADLLRMAQPFLGLSDANGHIGAGLFDNAAEVSRVESQGRGLLGSLFGNVDEIAGRLGTALGGSGSNASRLLSLAAPLILSVLGGKAKAGNLGAGALSSLLGGLGGNLTSLLPAGLGGLGALLGTGTAAAAPAAVKAATPAPRPATPPAAPITPPPSSPVTTERRGGFPWWLAILLPLLLLGGCWLLRPKPAADTATTPPATTDTATTPATNDTATTPATDGTFAINEPAADATLPAGGFTMTGTGKAGDEVELFEDGTSLGKVKIGDDGTWSFDVPSPAAGAHTYSVKGPDGAELGSVAATISAPDANASAANCTDEYSLSITDGQTVNEPFRFGGKGQGKGYSVTVKRGDRQIGVKDIPLDATCGWSYQSKPGAGTITYEVRPLGDAAATPLSTVNLTVNKQ